MMHTLPEPSLAHFMPKLVQPAFKVQCEATRGSGSSGRSEGTHHFIPSCGPVGCGKWGRGAGSREAGGGDGRSTGLSEAESKFMSFHLNINTCLTGSKCAQQCSS